MLKEQTKSAVCGCNFCGSCVEFDPTQAGEVVNCPHCNMETVVQFPDNTSTRPEEKYRLKVIKLEWETSNFGVRYLVGEVVNRSTADLDWAKIEFLLFGAGDAPVGLTSDSVRRFSPAEIWKFRAPVFQKTATRALIRVVSCEYGKSSQTQAVGISFTPEFLHEPAKAVGF